MEEPRALLPAYGVDHLRNQAGLTFPETIDKELHELEYALEHTQAQLRGVQARVIELQHKAASLKRTRAIYFEIMEVAEPAVRVPLSWAKPKPKPKSGRGHGTNSSYISGCRCAECKRGHADYANELRRRHRAETAQAQG